MPATPVNAAGERASRTKRSCRHASREPSTSQTPAANQSMMADRTRRWSEYRSMETMPAPMTTAHDAGGISSSTRLMPNSPAIEDGPAGPSRLPLTPLACRDSRPMAIAPVIALRRAVPVSTCGGDASSTDWSGSAHGPQLLAAYRPDGRPSYPRERHIPAAPGAGRSPGATAGSPRRGTRPLSLVSLPTPDQRMQPLSAPSAGHKDRP